MDSAELAKYIPKGYILLDSASGDLNRDEYNGLILVLNKPDEKETSDVSEHPTLRPLLLLIGQPSHTYKVVARNDKAVYCVDCGGMMGDPFTQIVIKNGYFSIEHYGGSSWRWGLITTFKYSATDKIWYLYKQGSTSMHTSDPDKVKTKITTTKNFGKIPFSKYDIYKED
ncbi:hypothetical protein D0T08_18815 [Emticicia sp. C21]|nr:hypothetical protein D0T08_18815 [Emticicia sp. C21]